MKKNILYAPKIDSVVESLYHAKDLLNPGICFKLREIYSFFSCLKTSNDDDLRQIWLRAERGGIRNFGSFSAAKREGEVETIEEFEEMWKSYYPDEIKWYKFQTCRYRDEMFFYFDDKLIFTINIKEEPEEKKDYNLEYIERFLDWLAEKDGNWIVYLTGSSIGRVEEIAVIS